MKVALVTGAYKGLGFEWCRQLGLQGYNVILTARDVLKATDAANQLKALGVTVYPKALDVINETQLKEIASWSTYQFGKIDLIINNAGVNPKDYTDKTRLAKTFYLNELDAHELMRIIHINSIAPLLIVKHVRELLRASDQPMVINISSWLGSITNMTIHGHYGYTGSKSLLNALNKAMANELKEDNIICVNVNPGWVQTDMGGLKATFTTTQAVTNLLQHVVSKISLEDTGKFFNHDGSVHPW